MTSIKTISLSIFLLALASIHSDQANASIIASISCFAINNGVLCDAGPTDFNNQNTYSYFWQATAPQSTPTLECNNGPNGQFFCFEDCLNGRFTGIATLTVTVTENATGLSDSASKTFSCNINGGGGGGF